MPVIDQSVVVARPPAEVFDFLVRGENLPLWDESVLECTPLNSGPVGVGTRFLGASSILGRRIPWTVEVTEFVPGVRSESRAVDGRLSFTVSYEVHPVPEGTQVRYRLVADAGVGTAFGLALGPVVQKVQTKTVKANLDRLVHLLEATAA